MLRRLEDTGFAVESLEPGTVVFETGGVERLYGGVEAALRRALASVGAAWDPRAGAGARRFVALAAASVARPGQAVIVEGKGESFLEPLPLTLLPLEAGRYAELEGLGVRRLGDLARLPGEAVAERLGPEGKLAWSLARGEERHRARIRIACVGDRPRLSWPRSSPSPKRLRMSSRSGGRSGRCSIGCSRVRSVQGGPSGRSPSRRGSSVEDRGGARHLARSDRRKRPAPLRARSEALEIPCAGTGASTRSRSSSPSTPGSSWRSSHPRGKRSKPACEKGCDRFVPAPGQDRFAQSSKSRRGRGSRRRGHSSCPVTFELNVSPTSTTSRAQALDTDSGRAAEHAAVPLSSRPRSTAPHASSTVRCDARPRGVARGRSLVDRRAESTGAISRSCSNRDATSASSEIGSGRAGSPSGPRCFPGSGYGGGIE